MAKTICLAQSKGGTGKTTSTLNIGAALVEAGYKVLLCDIDQQFNLTTALGVDPVELPKTMRHLLTEQNTTAQDVIITTGEGLDLIPASLELDYAEPAMPQIAREKVLARKLAPIKANYDFILIDTPPYFGTFVINAMSAADYLLVPVQPEKSCLMGLFALVERFQAIKDNINPNLQLLGLFVTLYSRNRAAHVQITESLRRDWPDYLFQSIMRLSARNDKATFEGRSIIVANPNSELAQDYRTLTQEILQRSKTISLLSSLS